ncbi:transmembrane protein 62 isoform X2 [Halyomorpha halys]|uniref:transmembrane protein 62 isoform X2 n=1 Tax=Halyomorpha halys TaxID=286706 RepID=UPI000D0C8D8F|nr:transmembrane protein 62-like isoform X2 [Halyomorpha halys]
MRFTKVGMSIFFLLVGFSIFIAHVFGLISVNQEEKNNNGLNSASKNLTIGDSFDHLMWFVQVSDLHLSQFRDKTRGISLLELCDFTFKHIDPSLILATGDLTDGFTINRFASLQFQEEWIMYKEILNKCSTVKKIPWLDIRGNHDNFNVPDVSKNLFLKYSMQGRNHSRSYLHKMKVGSETYAFVAVDACPDVGIKMPFNFAGMLSDKEIESLIGFRRELQDVNYTVWFGHYPTSCIISQPEIRNIIASDQKSMAYLCGHFHTFMGLAPGMYSLQKSGFYELELADWLINRMFRVAAIDHGLLSFVDVKHNDWPIVLLTNPKHALFQSRREPLNAMLSSTHIRVLVFSPDKIDSVKIKIDSDSWNNASHISGPLYVLPWEPFKYSSGIHNIEVLVLDLYGREKVVNQPFSLDGSQLEFKLFSKILLMLKFNTILQVWFGLAVTFCILPFCLLRYLNKQVLDGKLELECLRKDSFIHHWLKSLWILSNMNSLFYPMFLYPIYITIGPWAIAELVEGHYGLIFLWGIFVNGTFITDTFPYVYALIQIFLFEGPIIFCTAYSLGKRLHEYPVTYKSKLLRGVTSFISGLLYVIILMFQLLLAYADYRSYGPLAVIGPFRSWPVVLVVWCWYCTKTVYSQTVRPHFIFTG